MKKIIIGALAGLFTLIGLTNAQAPGVTNPTFTISNGNTNTYNGITTSFDPNANFTSDTYLSKTLFYNYNTSCPFKSATFWNEGKLYIVSWGLCDNSLKWQGYAYLCKVESIATNQFCRTYYDEGNPSLTEYYTEQYANPDYFQFYGYNNPHIGCFVYEDLSEKLCFGVQQDNSNGLDTTTQLFNTAPTGYDDPRFAEFAGDSYRTNREDQPTGYDPKTGLPCITLEQLYTTDTTYNTGMCYTSNKIRTGTLTGGHFETVTPKNLNQIYPTYTQLRNDINTYYNYCTSPNIPERCMTAFSGNEDSYSIVSKLPNNIKPNILYDYCNTREIYSGNMNINICDLTTGNIADMVPSMLTPEGQAENLLNQGIGITQPGSGSVFDNYKGIKIRDTVEAMQSVYDKITGIFKNNTGVDGILPGYIVRIIIISLLFVLFKK